MAPIVLFPLGDANSLAPNDGERPLNWEEAQGEAKKFRAVLKRKWPALTDDDLLALERHKHVFLFRLQQRVGGELRDLEQQFDALLPPVNERSNYEVIFLGPVWRAV